MAYPIWLTPAGNLGIVPELEYYQFPLDAYDNAGGTLTYSLVSGKLPPGLQVVATGFLQGIPVSTATADENQTYSFTVRVTNIADGNVADRTFQLTITNIAPPIITPRNVDLGTYFDGSAFNLQLKAVEFIPGATLTWSLESGTIPPGLSLSSTGLLSGYIYPIPSPTVEQLISNNVATAGQFVIGDLYSIVSIGTTDFTLIGAASNTVNLEFIATGVGSGTGTAALLDPAWDNIPWDDLGWQSPLGAISQNFNFTVEVTDGVNYDLSTYKLLVIPCSLGTVDSSLVTVDSTSPTIDAGSLHFPIIVTTQADFVPERQGGWFSQQIEAIDLDGDTLQYQIPALLAGTFDEQNIVGEPTYINAVATTGNITVGTVSSTVTSLPALVFGDSLQVLIPYTDPDTEQSTLTWYNATVNYYTTVVLTGNSIVSASPGGYISQTISGANATISNVSATTGTITYGGGLLKGTITVYGINVINANVGAYITQPSSGANATITANVANGITVSVIYNSGTFTVNSGNLLINGVPLVNHNFNSNVWSNTNSYPISISSAEVYTVIAPNVGDIITQNITGANATVITAHGSLDSGSYANTQNPYTLTVMYNSGTFITGASAGNLRLNGSNIAAYPTNVVAQTSISAQYNNTNVFTLNSTAPSAAANVNGVITNSYPTSITSVGVTVNGSPNTQGSGFDETLFDQEQLVFPSSLSIDVNSGWITGFLPSIDSNQVTYPFQVAVYKKENVDYVSTQLYNLTILGSLNNNVTWLTPPNIGTIENGAVSDLSITAFSSVGKNIYYQYTPGAYINLPQGLTLLPDGLLSGRVSFEVFSVDQGTTTFDVVNSENGVTTSITTFDHSFSFSVDAITFDQTASATQVFTITVKELNLKPYEDLYLKSYMSQYQRQEYQEILLNQSIFPLNLLYRPTDPWFGISQDITTLFLAGLNPSTAEQYANAVSTNHFGKRLLFGDVKTAVAREEGVYDVISNSTGGVIGTFNINTNLFVPTDFTLGYTVSSTIPNNTTVGQQHIKYEVVYVDVLQENYSYPGENNPDTINLSGTIANPYYDSNGNPYYIATPNSFSNMDDAIVKNIGYANKAVLPDWMTSTQPNGTQLGFTRAVVLAYVQPGAGATVAWRFQQQGYDLNELNFTVDSYLLDNTYSTNYDISANAFITSRQTTFDRYPALEDSFTQVGTVDYAVNIPFEYINELGVSEVNINGGLDGITSFTSGQTLVFYKQEFSLSGGTVGDHDQGWHDSQAPWDSSDISVEGEWDYDSNTGWDSSVYVPGYTAWNDNRVVGNVTYYPQINERIGVWTINVNSDDYVTLTPTLLPSATAASISGNILTVAGAVTSEFYPGMMIYGNATVGGTSSIPANTYVISQLTSTVGNVFGGAGTYLISSNITLSTSTIYQDMTYNNTIYVRQGSTHGGLRIYYDPTIKTGTVFPSWTALGGQQAQIKTTGTTFDGGGTLFYDYRDTYTVPEQGDGVVVFPHQNVFD